MNCPVCGTLLPTQAKFCSQCGSPRAVPLGSAPLRLPRPPSAHNSATKWLLAGAAVVLAAAAWLALKPGALTSNGPAGSTATPDAPTDETKAAALVGPQGVPGAQVAPVAPVSASTPGTSAAPIPSTSNASAAKPAGSAAAPTTAASPTAPVVAPPSARPVAPLAAGTATTALPASPSAPAAPAPTIAAKPSAPAGAQPSTAQHPAPKEAPTLNDLLD